MVNNLLGFKVRCKCHAEDPEPIAPVDDDENIEVATTSTKSTSIKLGHSWKQVVEAFSDITFIIYLVVYSILMLVYLN